MMNAKLIRGLLAAALAGALAIGAVGCAGGGGTGEESPTPGGVTPS